MTTRRWIWAICLDTSCKPLGRWAHLLFFSIQRLKISSILSYDCQLMSSPPPLLKWDLSSPQGSHRLRLAVFMNEACESQDTVCAVLAWAYNAGSKEWTIWSTIWTPWRGHEKNGSRHHLTDLSQRGCCKSTNMDSNVHAKLYQNEYTVKSRKQLQ